MSIASPPFSLNYLNIINTLTIICKFYSIRYLPISDYELKICVLSIHFKTIYV